MVRTRPNRRGHFRGIETAEREHMSGARPKFVLPSLGSDCLERANSSLETRQERAGQEREPADGPALKLRNVQAGDAAGDDETLDLRRPFEDRVVRFRVFAALRGMR
jgi:hypothetical protein